jgi:hypothetical protein
MPVPAIFLLSMFAMGGVDFPQLPFTRSTRRRSCSPQARRAGAPPEPELTPEDETRITTAEAKRARRRAKALAAVAAGGAKGAP